ncbi:MAG: thiolase family protein [Candidatus Omnitrophica bacterium]|nr:thiolase family protein [Candidatus Omnitrophota bacterium]
MKDAIYILDGMRTPLGSPFRSLKDFSAAQLGGYVVERLVNRNRIPPKTVEELVLGNTVSAGLGQNLARQVVYLSGLPLTIPAYQVNGVCASGLQAVILATQTLLSFPRPGGMIVVGAESVSQAPHLVSNEDVQLGDKTEIDSVIHDGLRCMITGKHMGELAEDMAHRHKISRKMQDVYARGSHRKAYQARTDGCFIDEIVPVRIGKGKYLDYDERIREDVPLKQLAALPSVFRRGGYLTAGNSSHPCDGAAGVLLATEEMVKKYRCRPRAKVLCYASAAVSPKNTFADAAKMAIEKCLAQSELKVKDVDLFEVGEAFAAQAILTQNKLKIPDGKWNVWGGDIALGHPFGAAGLRILVTLLHALRRENKRRGVACVCAGGGMGLAIAIERV